jgi:amino acid transporter
MAGQFRDEDWRQDDESERRLQRTLKQPDRRSSFVLNHPEVFAFIVSGIFALGFGVLTLAAGAALSTALTAALVSGIPCLIWGLLYAQFGVRRRNRGRSD